MEKKNKNKGGRPPRVLNEEELIQVEALAAFLTMEQIADYLGVSRPTFNQIMERQPEVSLRYKKGHAKAVGAVAQNVLMQAREGNLTASIFYLKTRGGWKETQTVDNISSDGSMTPKQITRVIVDPKKADK